MEVQNVERSFEYLTSDSCKMLLGKDLFIETEIIKNKWMYKKDYLKMIKHY